MNITEAEKILVHATHISNYYQMPPDALKTKSALTVAEIAMERQKPKKPARIKKTRFICPTCGLPNNISKNARYCLHCGQAIDWSKENV